MQLLLFDEKTYPIYLDTINIVQNFFYLLRFLQWLQNFVEKFLKQKKFIIRICNIKIILDLPV